MSSFKVLIEKKTRCVCETQMANSKDGQDHKDIYFDTSEIILSQEMTVCNMEALIFIYTLEVMTNDNLKEKVKCQGQKASTNRKILSEGVRM